MSDNLKSALEALSGFDLSAVRVHRNSPDPAKVNAFAYTTGNDISLGPGHEQYLPHEGWHVVQQLQGRVKPTVQTKGMQLNDDTALEREADVMGARAQASGDQVGARFHANLSTADGASTNDDLFAAATLAISQRPIRRLQAPTSTPGLNPIMQRAASFSPGPINATTNLASHVIAGGRDMGFTPPTLNGSTILSTAAAQAAIVPPALAGESKPDGTVDTWIATVPTNNASFTMQLPATGPWSTITPRANVVALFASLGLASKPQCSSSGDTTFSFHGLPSDATFKANVQTHETLHATDHEAAFNTVIVAWDARLQAAQTAGTRFNGPTVAAAEAALHTAMGGTPGTIASNQFAEWIRLNGLTHSHTTLATGGTATPSNSTADAACSTSSIDAT